MADQRFRIGRPDGKIRASLVSTFRLGLMTTGFPVSVLRFGAPALPLAALRFGVVMFRLFGFRAIVELPCADLAMPGTLKSMPMQAFLQALQVIESGFLHHQPSRRSSRTPVNVSSPTDA
jgi:hypothetical protein